MRTEESTLISKGPCGLCGSSDANALYSDGHSHCFSCTTTVQGERPVNTAASTESSELGSIVARWNAHNSFKAMPERALPSAYVGRYRVMVTDSHHYYPYFAEGTTDPVGFKVRGLKDKSFRVVGNIKEAGLFGQQRYGSGSQGKILVTEGEVDAIAASLMLDDKTPVVSLRSGAAGASRDFKAAYEFLDAFEEIIVAFDADDAGKEAVEKAAEIFAGKLKVVRLDPKAGKDAGDYVKANLHGDFVRLFVTASTYTPKGIMSSTDLWERLSADKPAATGDYPWPSLNALTFGYRPTELVTVTAGSGLGKSAVLREIVMHIKGTTDHRVGCLFLEESVERTAEGFMAIDLSTPVHLPTASVKRGDDAYRESFDRCFDDGKLLIMDASFDTGASVDAVVSRVRFMAKALDCKVIILDHLSLLVSGGHHNDERKAIDAIMTKLRTLTQDTGITLFVVSHLKRPEGRGHEAGAVTSVSQLRGSAAIAQLSDFVIGLERDGQADDPIKRNTTNIRVLKNRYSGITGPAGSLLYDNETGRLTEFTPPEDQAL